MCGFIALFFLSCDHAGWQPVRPLAGMHPLAQIRDLLRNPHQVASRSGFPIA